MDPRYSTSRYGHPRPRSPTFNPARASLPTMPSSAGYTSAYGGDIHVMPTSSRNVYLPNRGYDVPASPVTTTTYAVSKDPLTRGSSLREGSRNRRSTLDSSAHRPVIVTTTQNRPQPGASHTSSGSGGRHGSPIRDEYSASDSHFWTQPASSIRSRSHNRGRSYGGGKDDLANMRSGDGLLTAREPYRGARPSSVYQNSPRVGTAPVDYGGDGYEYYSPSDLARYDLSHNARPSRSHRRDSFDRSGTHYGRSHAHMPPDVSRTYNNSTPRYDSRGGPPPSTRGFDKINRGYDAAYEQSQAQIPAPPPAPHAPAHHAPVLGSPKEYRTAGSPETTAVPSADPRSSRRRPVSVYHEGGPRSSHYDDYSRRREDDRHHRPGRDLDREYDAGYNRASGDPFRDDGVNSRGFGIRADATPAGAEFDDRRESRRETRAPDEVKRSSDEELKRLAPREDDNARTTARDSSRADKERESREHQGHRERRTSAGIEDAPDRERLRDKLNDKVGTGLGIAATALGFNHMASKDDKKDDQIEKEPRRWSDNDERDRDRRGHEDRDRRRDDERYRPRGESRDAWDRSHTVAETRSAGEPKDDAQARERHRRDAEARLGGETSKHPARDDGATSDEGQTKPRRQRASMGFNPTDPQDLQDVKEQLAAMNASESPRDKGGDRPRGALGPRESAEFKEAPDASQRKEPHLPSGESTLVEGSSESRGRELVHPKHDEKQVRVVSPPRDKSDSKPLKGILKQPSKFPEENNPVREGVAPHKDDKKYKDAPPGARWTKISRKVVNPEALKIGKERFEIRDDFVIVLRVLSKEEIQAYAVATQQLRDRRRDAELGNDRDRGDRDYERDADRDRARDRDSDRERERGVRDRDYDEEDRSRSYRTHRRDDDLDQYDEDRDRDRERHRRHRREDETEDSRYYQSSRSYRERDRERQPMAMEG